MIPTQSTDDDGDRSSWRNGLLLALLIWLLAGMLYRQSPQAAIGDGELRGALDASRLIKSHQSEYAGNYVTTPLPAVALRPLARMPETIVAQLWRATCVLSLLVAIGLFAKAAQLKLHEAAPLGILLIVGFYFPPTQLDFSQAQLQTPVLALLCAAYLADSQGRAYRLATCIALAALIKLWLLALLVYLLFRRRVLPFFWGLLLFAGAMAGLLARVGWREIWSLLDAAKRHQGLDLAFDYRNQSLLGFARVHFGPNSAAQPVLDNPILLNGVVAVGFFVILAGLKYAFRIERSAEPEKRRLCLGLTIVSLLLACPICRPASFVLLLPTVWTLLACDGVPGLARTAGAAAYVLLTCSVATSNHPAGLESLAPSSFFFGASVLWLALMGAIAHRQKRQADELDTLWD
ncbi:MAG TPA: glycosyltransferase 87 family protein [Tepidisphaeraceae bacterium]|nr:glycosyltransferase 87 family protein [Tepidisphaeraceae bacterium]